MRSAEGRRLRFEGPGYGIATLGVLFPGNGIIPPPGMNQCGIDRRRIRLLDATEELPVALGTRNPAKKG